MGTTVTISDTKLNSNKQRSGSGWLYEMKAFGSEVPSFAMDIISPPYVNVNEMSAWATISTATPDRVGDVLIPRGIITTNYEKNPSCYWNHGLDSWASLPIGVARNPDGSLALDINDDRIIAKTYFAQRNPVAIQVFNLIEDGIIVATSVRETPKSQRKSFLNGEQITIVDSWEIEEISWCGIGINPDAVAKCVSKNRLDGRPIDPSILKSLTATLPKKPATSHGGFTEKPMSTLKSPGSDLVDDDDKKDPAETPADESPKGDDKPVETSDDKPKEKPDDVMDGGDKPTLGDPDSDMMLGRQTIGQVHDGLKSLRGTIRSCCKSMEEPTVRDHMQSLHDNLGEHATALQGLRQEKYPSSSVLKDEDMSGEDGGDSDDEGGGDTDSAMKSMMGTINAKRLSFVGALESVKAVLTSCKSLSAGERKKLNLAIDQFTKLNSQAKSYRPEPAKVEVKTETKPKITADEQAKIDEAYALLKS